MMKWVTPMFVRSSNASIVVVLAVVSVAWVAIGALVVTAVSGVCVVIVVWVAAGVVLVCVCVAWCVLSLL